MKNYIDIRPHHFMCIKGYVGVTRTIEHKNTWDRVSTLLQNFPQTKVKITLEKDDLCIGCMAHPAANNTCSTESTAKYDTKIKSLLNLEIGKIYQYDKVSEKLAKLLNINKHKKICGDCTWRDFGLCKDTFKK